jgi:hypothetical protein
MIVVAKPLASSFKKIERIRGKKRRETEYQEMRRTISTVRKQDLLDALQKYCCSAVEFSILSKKGDGFIRIGGVEIPANIMFYTMAMDDEGATLHDGKISVRIDYDAIEALERAEASTITIETTKFSIYIFINRVEAIKL